MRRYLLVMRFKVDSAAVSLMFVAWRKRTEMASTALYVPALFPVGPLRWRFTLLPSTVAEQVRPSGIANLALKSPCSSNALAKDPIVWTLSSESPITEFEGRTS